MRTTCAMMVLVLFVSVAPPARAEFCLDFVDFCDGLELTVEGDMVYGWWRNANCFGADSPMVGIIQDGLPNPCLINFEGRVGVACDERFGCKDFLGAEWYFVFNEPNGEVHLGVDNGGPGRPPGTCASGTIAYVILPGPCPFFAPGIGKSLLSTVQAGR